MNFQLKSASKGMMEGGSGGGGASGTSSDVTDLELVTRSQGGDYRAFDALVTRHRGRVYAMIRNMVKNDADAWDLSQEAFVKVWKALPRFERRAKFSTWLYRIVHNVVYDWSRKRKIILAGELNDEVLRAGDVDASSHTTPSTELPPDKALERDELRERIARAMDKLKTEHREVILMREVGGLNYKEISEATGASMGTVMSRLFYARKKLQTYLSNERESNTTA